MSIGTLSTPDLEKSRTILVLLHYTHKVTPTKMLQPDQDCLALQDSHEEGLLVRPHMYICTYASWPHILNRNRSGSVSDEEVHVTVEPLYRGLYWDPAGYPVPDSGSELRQPIYSNTEVIPLSLGNSPVGGHDEYGCHVRLQCAVEEGEALNVQHVHFVHKQHARDNLGLPLLPPLSHLGVDLFSNLALNLTCVT